MNDRLSHVPRSDARDNRERILRAARALFAADGPNISVRQIARHAGVAPATLYRHFPTKQALLAEATRDELRACHAAIAERLADPDPWHGFRVLIENTCEQHARNRGFTEVFISRPADTVDFAADRAAAIRSISRLARRAQDAGGLRPDFVVDDLLLMLRANQGIRATSTAARVAASQRFAAYVIQAFQASTQPVPLPPVPRLMPAGMTPVRAMRSAQP